MIGTIVFVLLAALVLAAGLVLALPVRLRFEAHADDVSYARVQAQPLGGLVPAITLTDSRRRKPPAQRDTSRPKRRKGAGRSGLRMAAALPELAAQLLRRFHAEDLTVRGRFGLSDPSDTGLVFGYLTPLIYGTAHSRRISVDIAPDFDGPLLTGHASGVVRFVPATLVPPLVHFAWRAFGPKR